MKKILLGAAVLLMHSMDAQKQKFTMAEAVNGLRSSLAIQNIQQFSWLENQDAYLQGVKNAYLKTDIKTGKKDTLVSLSQLNAIGGHTFAAMPRITFIDENKGYFQKQYRYFWLEKKNNTWSISEMTGVDNEVENVYFSKKKDMQVFTRTNNLYIRNGGQVTPITQEQNPNIISGQSVHRQEFGIDKGIFVSPNENKIAFYKMDESMVEDYPIVEWHTTPAQNKNIKYPMAGRTSHQVKLGIYSIAQNKTIYLNIDGEKDQYLTAVTWSPDEKTIFVGVLNRGQNHLKFNQYNAETGAFIKTLFEEKSDKYVEPQHAAIFFPHSTKDFIWQSQRTGYNHLFHYHVDKGLIGQITKGDWLVNSVLGFYEKNNEIIISGTKDSPLQKNLYKVNWKNKKITRINTHLGVHNAALSKSGAYLYDVYSAKNTPRKVDIIHLSTGKVQNLLTAEDPLRNFDRPQIQLVTLKADDGTPLYGKLIKPTNFDANKKYPVIVYLYNGPHLQLVTDAFPESGNLWYEYMAQRGFVVFTMDGRGSSNRGLAFEQAVFRQLGEVEMKDQLKGVEYLKSLPFVDAKRMGIHGWSFGGFMTTSFMLKYPDVFKAGVAGGPVIDWRMYEVMYTERYMDTPQENPEGYAKANLLDKVENLKGKLLMIHGAQDDVVVWQHSIDFLKSAVDKGVQVDYFVYPGHAHNVVGRDRVHLMQKVTDYFEQHLKEK